MCGDDRCEVEEGEDCSVCPRDCGTCPLKTWQIALIVTAAAVILIGVLSLVCVSSQDSIFHIASLEHPQEDFFHVQYVMYMFIF